ncbi:MAG TPA: Flp pilus assembly protein CpaB [Methylocella sp.]|nr:Flp pilus assembly protein CpaB [Methylocella sp.]
MKPARIAVLGIALVAGLSAAILAGSSKPAPPAAPPPLPTDGVLIAARDLNAGSVLTPGDMRWDPRPKDHIAEDVIRQSAEPNAIAEWTGAVICTQIAAGDSLRAKRMNQDKNPQARCLPFDLYPGMRAVAIEINTQGSSTAGGFILPGSRVDVVHTFHDEDAQNSASQVSRIILTNRRVLAIGQTREKEGDPFITGATVATLELTPAQAETVVLAQRTGQLSLILRSVQDADASGAEFPDHSNGMMVVRHGVPVHDKAH